MTSLLKAKLIGYSDLDTSFYTCGAEFGFMEEEVIQNLLIINCIVESSHFALLPKFFQLQKINVDYVADSLLRCRILRPA